MKKYEIQVFNGTENIASTFGRFLTHKSAVAAANLFCEQLRQGRSDELTYSLTEVPETDEDGNLVENKKQEKKKLAKGGRTQTMFNFRLDNDLRLLLEGVENKGRFINNLIRRALVYGENDRPPKPEEFNDRHDKRP